MLIDTLKTLKAFEALSPAEQKNFSAAFSRRRHLDACQRMEFAPGSLVLLLDGFAYRYKLLSDGRRQIVGFLVPGDLVLSVDVKKHDRIYVDMPIHSVVAVISETALKRLLDRSPNIARLLWWLAERDLEIARAWLANIGQKEAHERLAHLLCELYFRMQIVRCKIHRELVVPISQKGLADSLGLSNEHVNRTLKRLRIKGLLEFKGGILKIFNLPGLIDIARFDATYLHAALHC